MPTLSPDPQYTPREFAHGSVTGLQSNIPRICGYRNPHTFIEQFTPGYFGPAQTRPELDGTIDITTGASGGTGTDSTNQGQPSLGTTLPFGSLIFWRNEEGTGLHGWAARIDATGTGYGKKPALTEVLVTGGVF